MLALWSYSGLSGIGEMEAGRLRIGLSPAQSSRTKELFGKAQERSKRVDFSQVQMTRNRRHETKSNLVFKFCSLAFSILD